MSESGIVYVLTNPGMPELVKIGSTNDLKTRLNNLYGSLLKFRTGC